MADDNPKRPNPRADRIKRKRHRAGLGTVLSLVVAGLVFAVLALSLSGLAWNLMYVGGSTLLASVNDEENRALIQGANEFFGFAMTALGTFSTGLLFASHGWGHIAALSTAVCVGLYLLFALLRTERKRLIR